MASPVTAHTPERFATLVSVLLIIIVVAVLYFAKEIFVPLALALLFSFLLTPLVTRFERWRLGRVPSVMLAVLIAFAIIGGVGYLVGNQLVDLTYKLPSYQHNIATRLASLKKTNPDSAMSKATLTIQELGKQISDNVPAPNSTRPDSTFSSDKEQIRKVQIVEPATNMAAVAQSVLGPVVGPLGTAAVVIVFVLFMLLKREDLRDRIIHLVGKGNVNTTTQALDEAASKVAGYLTMQVIVNVSFGVPIGIGLYFIGVPNAFLWGMLAVVLRFIPYVGAWIALGFPLLLSLAVTTTWSMPISVLALYAVIELVTSNVLEPWLYGAHTGLSPVAIMVSTIFWTWLWGGVGLLLAMPLTVCVSVLGKYIPSLSFLEAILGDEPTLTVNERYYQRLLAMDRREAYSVADEFRKEHTLPELYSRLFVPALTSAESEEQQGTLEDRQRRFIFDATREMVEETVTDADVDDKRMADKLAKEHKLDPESKEEVAPDGGDVKKVAAISKYPIFCLPAADEADELVAVMLSQLLEHEGYKAESLSYKTLANEMVAHVIEAGGAAVCISTVPPYDNLHTRYLCKLLRSRIPNLHILVGTWDGNTDEARIARRKDRYSADRVVTTLTAALDEIRPFAGLEVAKDAVA